MKDLVIILSIVVAMVLLAQESDAATGTVTMRVLTKQEAYERCIVRLTNSVKPKTPHQATLIVDKCRSK